MADTVVVPTFLPPAPLRRELSFDPVQCVRPRRMNGPQTNLDYADCVRMRVQKRAEAPYQQMSPEWANNDHAVLVVLAKYFENRANLRGERLPGSEHERLERAHQLLQERQSVLIARLEKLCKREVELRREGADPARIRELDSLIAGVDGEIRVNVGGPGLIMRIVFLSWRCRMNSVTVAAEVQLRPPAVRQILRRLRRIYDEMDVEGRNFCASDRLGRAAGHRQ